MYLTAQRVRDLEGHEGTNAFYYWSGVDVWSSAYYPPLTPDRDPGELVHPIITLLPPGNRVRSYLDVVATDLTPSGTIRHAFAMADGRALPDRLPFTIEIASCWFRFGAEHGLASMWRQEFRRLFECAITAYQVYEPPGPGSALPRHRRREFG
jgi:hypothetical protein